MSSNSRLCTLSGVRRLSSTPGRCRITCRSRPASESTWNVIRISVILDECLGKRGDRVWGCSAIGGCGWRTPHPAVPRQIHRDSQQECCPGHEEVPDEKDGEDERDDGGDPLPWTLNREIAIALPRRN